MPDELNVGDTVSLKSGGPLMTIESIDDYTDGRKARCLWFDGKKRMSELFALATLLKVKV